MYKKVEDLLVEQSLEILSLDSLFKSQRVKEFVEEAFWRCVPIEFFLQPASSSGKYHPTYSLGVGGTVRHTKAALILAQELFPLYDFTDLEQDYIIAALCLHDVCKPSKLHPIEVKRILDVLVEDYPSEVAAVVYLIESHMGQWDQYGKLPRPDTDIRKFVHLCDYLASRKCITVETVSREGA